MSVRNNPLRYTDPSGEEIYVGGLSPEDLAELLRRVHYTYGCNNCASVDEHGNLAVDTTGLSKEVLKATQYLTNAINAKAVDYFAVVIVKNNSADIDFGASGTTVIGTGKNKRRVNAIGLDFGDDAALIGPKEIKEAFAFTTFAHEVAHQYPNAQADPELSTNGRETGPVVDAVNKILYARGLPLRSTYYEIQGSGTSAFGAIYFGSAEVKNGQTQYNKQGGIKVKQEKEKLLKWNRLNIGGIN